MGRGPNLERKINATVVRILGEKYSIQEMMDAFGLGRTIIYNYKKNKMPEDFLEEHEQNIKGFVRDLEDILYTLKIKSDSHQKIPYSLVDILKAREDILDDIVDYSNFYISEQHEKWYENYDTEKHRKDIMDKPYITFISPELGEITLTYREYREFMSRKRVAIRNYKEIDFNFEEFFNKQLEENEDEIGLLYDILRYNSNFLTAVKYRDQSVMETIYENAWNSGDGINYMKKMSYVINMFRERKWITEITDDEWVLISVNIDKIEIDKYNKKDFSELIKSIRTNKKCAISTPPENYKDKNPESMENNINYFIERIREFEKSSDKSIYNMDKFGDLYRNIKWNKKVEDRVIQILSSEIRSYGINHKRVVSYLDILNKTLDSIGTSKSSIALENIEYAVAFHQYSHQINI